MRVDGATQSAANRTTWEYRAYEFWTMKCGEPADYAIELLRDPAGPLGKLAPYLGEVKGKRILVPLGSNGRKAIPLALLGAEVVIVDISGENRRYALELARHCGVVIEYALSDIKTFDVGKRAGSFDTVMAEGGILHYLDDLEAFFAKLARCLGSGGSLVLNDFHPIRKYVKFDAGGRPRFEGSYYDEGFHEGPVAYEDRFPESERAAFPKCSLKFWNLSQILSAIGASGLQIKVFDEGPDYRDADLPGDLTVEAIKP